MNPIAPVEVSLKNYLKSRYITKIEKTADQFKSQSQTDSITRNVSTKYLNKLFFAEIPTY